MNRACQGGQNPFLGAENFPIIVHCHLQWEWVWQRPQQIFSRLAKNHRVLFVETLPPDAELEAPRIRRQHPVLDNLTVAQVQFPTSCWHDGALVDRERRSLVQDLISGPLLGKFDSPVQWFYDPMAVTAFAGYLNEVANVYDCMDELSKFNFAPPGIAEREKTLLSIADVVFTGGRKLFESKRRHNSNCHFYGCGVDVEHFGKAMREEVKLPRDLKDIPGPRLGYIGVVDERIDYGLLAKLADANPKWSVVIVGPTAKVDPKTFPQRANLHWLGARSYEELPNYLKGFGVCLMPFALNAATEFINPTKALEYLASGRPVVSTAVADVITNFPPVAVAHTATEFVDKCIEAIVAPDEAAIADGVELARQNTWKKIVGKMEQHIVTALSEKRARRFTHPEYLELEEHSARHVLTLR